MQGVAKTSFDNGGGNGGTGTVSPMALVRAAQRAAKEAAKAVTPDNPARK